MLFVCYMLYVAGMPYTLPVMRSAREELLWPL